MESPQSDEVNTVFKYQVPDSYYNINIKNKQL